MKSVERRTCRLEEEASRNEKDQRPFRPLSIQLQQSSL